jgi:uncharacterized protein YjbI with pentapeptide repeats
MSKQTTNSHPFPEEWIRAKAHEIWQANGESGSPNDNWQAAIDQLKKERWLMIWRWQIWQWTGLRDKKRWDILELLIFPLGLVLATSLLQQCTKERELQVSDDKAKQETLVKYLDQMSELLKDGLLKSSFNSEKFIISQAKTVTALQSLDAKRQHTVIQFLAAANLNKLNGLGLLYEAHMSKAELSGSDLSGATLVSADLSRARFAHANLGGVNLNGANLSEADFSHAELGGATLERATLHKANLSCAELGGAKLIGADLGHSTLWFTRLNGAILSGSDLKNADMLGVSLTGVKLDNADLRNAKNVTQWQIGSALLCKTKLPTGIKLDPDRNCKKLGL